MSQWIPPRPRYRREQLIIGFPTLAVFSLLFVSFLIFGRWDMPDSLFFKLIPMVVSLLTPILLFWMLRGGGYTKALRLRAPRASYTPFLISAFFVLVSGGLLLSILFGGTETLGNSTVAFEEAAPSGILDTVLSVLVLGVLPAVLEELFFRGMVVAEYERRGAIRAVLMSALLFALCHFDLHNLAVYLFGGVVLALVLYATDSLIAAILVHVCYNAFSLLGQPYLNAFYRITGGMELFIFCLVLILLLFLVIFFGTAARIYHLRAQNGLKNPRRDVPWNVQFYTILDALSDPPILLCFVIAILGFIFL